MRLSTPALPRDGVPSFSRSSRQRNRQPRMTRRHTLIRATLLSARYRTKIHAPPSLVQCRRTAVLAGGSVPASGSAAQQRITRARIGLRKTGGGVEESESHFDLSSSAAIGIAFPSVSIWACHLQRFLRYQVNYKPSAPGDDARANIYHDLILHIIFMSLIPADCYRTRLGGWPRVSSSDIPTTSVGIWPK